MNLPRQPDSAYTAPEISLSQFIDASPSPAHAMQVIIDHLQAAGAQQLHPGEAWQLQPKALYFCNFSGRSICAWRMPSHQFSAFRTIAAHIDSPCFRIRERSVQWEEGFLVAGTEPYGGVLHASWLDRPLRIAGVAVVRDPALGGRQVVLELTDLQAIIPNLAIHLNRDINKGYEFNPQTQLRALVAMDVPDSKPQRPWEWLVARHLSQSEGQAFTENDILALDLFLADAQPVQLLGQPPALMNGPRMDNLAGCQAALQALVAVRAHSNYVQLVCMFDHEEIGSRSSAGADSTLFHRLVRRIGLAGGLADEISYLTAVERSILLSVDAAHARHPNFTDKHDNAYAPQVNAGIVLKTNANQRYATAPDGAARLRLLCENRGIPLQYFTNRADMACGSTIGPALAAASGMQTIDLGIPLLAMHSCRETAGLRDQAAMISALTAFLEELNNEYSKFPVGMLAGMLFCAILLQGLSAQTETGSTSPAPIPTPAGTVSPNPLPTASPTVNPLGYLQGSWKVERAIFELFGNLKEVTGTDDRFYAILSLGVAGKGTIRYGTRTSDTEIEYEMKSNQNLTIAFGSRLKPQIDLYQTLMLADGSFYLRSTRLAGVNGTVYYFLRKINP